MDSVLGIPPFRCAPVGMTMKTLQSLDFCIIVVEQQHEYQRSRLQIGDGSSVNSHLYYPYSVLNVCTLIQCHINRPLLGLALCLPSNIPLISEFAKDPVNYEVQTTGRLLTS